MSVKDEMREMEQAGEDQPLDPRKPIYLRIDGKNFSKMVKKWKLQQPLDTDFSTAMIGTTRILCTQAQGSVFGYTQSDEITIFLMPQNDKSEVWFNGRREKLVSISASMVTSVFNFLNNKDAMERGVSIYDLKDQASFDCRARNIDKEMILSYLIWRVRDSYKNAVTKISRSQFSHRQLNGIDTKTKEEMMAERGFPISDYPNHMLYGTFFYKVQETLYNDETDIDYLRNRWVQRSDWKAVNEAILANVIEKGYGEDR